MAVVGEKKDLFVYTYSFRDEPYDRTSVVNMYCLDENYSTVTVLVGSIPLCVYIELPDDKKWSKQHVKFIKDKIFPPDDENVSFKNIGMKYLSPIRTELVERKRLYYVHKNSDMSDKTIQCIRFTMPSQVSVNYLSSVTTSSIMMPNYGPISLRIHENDSSLTPVIRLINSRDIPSIGWVKIRPLGERKGSSGMNAKFTSFDKEYECNAEDVFPSNKKTMLFPKLMSFDIEAYSSVHSAMPDATKPTDSVFQISVVIPKFKKDPERYILFTLKHSDNLGGKFSHADIREFETELDLLCSFAKFIRKENPNIIVGYNILSWDIEYMINRSKLLNCESDFCWWGCYSLKEDGSSYDQIYNKEWSSSAYGKKKFHYIDAEGRLFIDVLHVIRASSDKKLQFPDYTLRYVTDHLLKEADLVKDTLKTREMFEKFRQGESGDIARIGMYCVQDSYSTLLLYQMLKIWFDISEIANIAHVPASYVFTRGQSIRQIPRIHKYCMQTGRIMENQSYIIHSDLEYSGASVISPKVGYHEDVLSFDFCLTGDNLISLSNGCSKRIDSLLNNEMVLGCENMRLNNYNMINGLQVKGKRDTVKVWLQDGTTICCTPDHNFMLDDGEWCRADELKDKYVTCGIDYPEDKICPLEKDWELKLDGCTLDMKSHENREKSLAFARMLGFCLTDGTICQYDRKGRRKKSKVVHSYFGSVLDVNIFIRDIQKFYDTDINITIQNYEDNLMGMIYSINVPDKLTKMIHSVENIMIGKRTNNPMKLPNFIMNENCPLSIVREFMAGMWGGDGSTPFYRTRNVFEYVILFKWSTIEKNKNSMEQIFNSLLMLLNRLGINGILREPIKDNYDKKSIKPKDHKENPRWVYTLAINEDDILKFNTNIGFRYCSHKSCCLTIVSSYLKMGNKTREQHTKVFNLALELMIAEKLTIRKALEKARREIFESEPPINIISMSSVSYINHRKNDVRRRLSLGPRSQFPSALDYLNDTRTISWFYTSGKKTYSVGRDDNFLPTFRKKVIAVIPDIMQNVYDIEVNVVHNYVANGVVTHNCSLYPSILVAYNIDYSTLCDDPFLASRGIFNTEIPDFKCNVFEWSEHINCRHDELRGKRSKKKVICGNYKYRFLKPEYEKGVVPSIIVELLSERKKVKREMESIIPEGQESEHLYSCGVFPNNVVNNIVECMYSLEEIHDKEVQKMVLNSRQLALKVMCNSIYGSMGSLKTYLSFIPGAMTVTRIGRMSIQRVQEENKELSIIYGDTDSLYCKLENQPISIEGYWIEAEKIVAHMKTIFPPPMSLDFENVIHKKFLLLSKKRYAEIQMERNGKMSELKSKGTLLVKRDFCPIVKLIYGGVINIFFDGRKLEIPDYLVDQYQKIFTRQYSNEKFIVSKSMSKGINEYTSETVPAHVVLAQRMIARGQDVATGSRMRYIFTTEGRISDKQSEKIEDYDFFNDNREVIRLDYLYYLKSQFKQVDDLIALIFSEELKEPEEEKEDPNLRLRSLIKKSTAKYQLKIRCSKHDITEQIKNFGRPRIVIG
jgi:DNA polymerase elongation subunit (family B)